jgi:hypothetical protein
MLRKTSSRPIELICRLVAEKSHASGIDKRNETLRIGHVGAVGDAIERCLLQTRSLIDLSIGQFAIRDVLGDAEAVGVEPLLPTVPPPRGHQRH